MLGDECEGVVDDDYLSCTHLVVCSFLFLFSSSLCPICATSVLIVGSEAGAFGNKACGFIRLLQRAARGVDAAAATLPDAGRLLKW